MDKSKCDTEAKREFDNKIADIINMAGFPMAIIEIDAGAEQAYCTEKVAEFFGVELAGWENNYVSKEVLVNALSPCRETLYPEYNEDSVFRYVLEDGGRRWFSIKIKEDAGQFFCVLMEVTESIRERRLMRRDRDFDALTGLYTRRALQRKMNSLLGERNVKQGILAVWDLDNLKYINDHYGHEVGDRYICMLSEIFRNYRIPDKIVSRLGGDEFVVVLHSDEIDKLIAKMKELHQRFLNEKLELSDGTVITGSASVGVALFSQGGYDYEAMFRMADDAMYDRKRNSKGSLKIAE